MLNNSSQVLVKLDILSSYIPFVSSVVNFVDIFQKCVVLPIMERKNIEKGHYYIYLDQKSFKRCIILLIPVFGNLIIGIYDVTKTLKRQLVLAAVKRNGFALKEENEEYRNDKEIALAAIRQNVFAAEFIGQPLHNDVDIQEAIDREGDNYAKDFARLFEANKDQLYQAYHLD